MQYRTMPKSDDKLSALGFGCMRLPSRTGGATIDKAAATKQVRDAIDKGVNYLDTAYLYPGSEEFLGECLKDGYREKVYIATKLPCGTIAKREGMDEIFQTQLKRLQTDYIDYYLLHSMDGDVWDKMLALGIIDFMDKLRASGKVRYMGFSFHGSNKDFKRMVDEYDWDFTQVGDVYAHEGYIWRCVAAHTTQSDWRPNLTPALWRKVEPNEPDAPRIWQSQTDYVTDDVVHYPDAASPSYRCIQGHTSQDGWEPPNVPALWELHGSTDMRAEATPLA